MSSRSGRGRSQAGLSLVEMATAIGISGLLVGAAVVLFKAQVKSNKNLRSQADLQSKAKKAVQELTQEISNTGALIVDPLNTRPGFAIAISVLDISYRDLRARNCPAVNDLVNMKLRVRTGGAKGDTLVKEVACNGGAVQVRPLVVTTGSIGLTFKYFRLDGTETTNRISVQRIRFTLDLRSSNGSSLYDKKRVPTADIDLGNY